MCWCINRILTALSFAVCVIFVCTKCRIQIMVCTMSLCIRCVYIIYVIDLSVKMMHA